MRVATARTSREKGQDLAEFAITLPILLMVLVVIVDLGRITYSYSTIYNAAREAARYGIINPYDTAGIENRALSIAVGLDASTLTITSSIDEDADTIEVIVDHDFLVVTPFADSLLPSNPLPISSRVTMRIER
jgi:hypothetical protein